MPTFQVSREARICSGWRAMSSALPSFTPRLRVERRVAGIPHRSGAFLILGHKVAQLLSWNVGTLVFVAKTLHLRSLDFLGAGHTSVPLLVSMICRWHWAVSLFYR